MTAASGASRARLALVGSVVVTGLVYYVPFLRPLAWPLLLLATLAHEAGHGIAALLSGGSFERLEMFADGSGLATWSGSGGRLQQAFVAAGGLVGPAVAAAGCFLAGRSPRGARGYLLALSAALLLAEILVVRTVFGFVFVGVVATALLVAARWQESARWALVFLGVQLSLSVFSGSGYLFVETAQTGSGVHPSDVAQIAAALWLPYWVWGALCGLFSLAVLVAGGAIFLRR